MIFYVSSSFRPLRHIVDPIISGPEQNIEKRTRYCPETPHYSSITNPKTSNNNNRRIHRRSWPTLTNTTTATKAKNTWNRTSITMRSNIRATLPRTDPPLLRTGKSQRNTSPLRHADTRISDLYRQQLRDQVEVHTQQQAIMGRELIPMPAWDQIWVPLI